MSPKVCQVSLGYLQFHLLACELHFARVQLCGWFYIYIYIVLYILEKDYPVPFGRSHLQQMQFLSKFGKMAIAHSFTENRPGKPSHKY